MNEITGYSKGLQRVVAGDATTVCWALHTEATLGHPLAAVWPLFQDMRRWYTEYTFEVLSGPAYQTGVGLLESQVLKLTSSYESPKPRGVEDVPDRPPHLHSRVIRVVPFDQIVNAVYVSSSPYIKRNGSFYVCRLVASGQNTTIHVETYGETQLLNPLEPDAMSEYVTALESNWRRSWTTALSALSNLVARETEAGGYKGTRQT